jgi:hypothetical protein
MRHQLMMLRCIGDAASSFQAESATNNEASQSCDTCQAVTHHSSVTKVSQMLPFVSGSVELGALQVEIAMSG